jgi:hypothetical protein
MFLKTLAAVTLLALSPLALAQSTDTTSGPSVGGVDVTKCSAMMGAEREKCLLEQRGGAAAGSTMTTTPGIATTTPAPLATPSSPTNPTTLPGSSTTPSGK